MYKYLWVVPLIVLVMVMAGCHGEGITTEPPTLTIQAPQQAHGTLDVTVEATPQEPGATITEIKVTFAGETKTIAGASGTVSFDVPQVSEDTPYTITVVARDSKGGTASRSREVTVTVVPPSAAPTVQILAPTNEPTVTGSFDVTVEATAQEPGATIDHIDVTANSTTKTISGATGTVTFNVSELSTSSAKATVAPAQAFEVRVQNATIALAGHTITAVATDSLGVTGSASTTVNTGGTTTVSVHLSDTSSVAGFQMTINYDKDVLKLVGGAAGVQKGAAVTGDNILQANTDTAGQIIAGLIGVGAGAELDNTKTEILTLEFQAIGTAGTTVISIDDTDQAPAKLTFGNTSIPPQPITPLPTAVDGTITIQ